jgi:hypothetical protein
MSGCRPATAAKRVEELVVLGSRRAVIKVLPCPVEGVISRSLTALRLNRFNDLTV